MVAPRQFTPTRLAAAKPRPRWRLDHFAARSSRRWKQILAPAFT
jgi:hypothetical protein